MKNLSPMKLAEGMFDEILALIGTYSESMPVATAIGVLELVKVQLINDHGDDDEEDDE